MWEGASGGSSMFHTALMNFSSTVDFIALGGGPAGGFMPFGATGTMAPAAVKRAEAGGGMEGAFMWEGASGTSGAGPFFPFFPLNPLALIASSFCSFLRVTGVPGAVGAFFVLFKVFVSLPFPPNPKMKDFQPLTFFFTGESSSPKTSASICLVFCCIMWARDSFNSFFVFFLLALMAPETSNTPPMSSVASYWSSTPSQSATPACFFPPNRKGWSSFCLSSSNLLASAAAAFLASFASISEGSSTKIHFSGLPSTMGMVFLSSPPSIRALMTQISAQASNTPPTLLQTFQGLFNESTMSSLFANRSFSYICTLHIIPAASIAPR
mmetsp:Transcript_15001/g.30895  ORF Transcript_15001/g.30895 Transcript_15001/m.30895 type:complete len:325 (-) Transcript_15001:2333-3307(-)